MRLAESATAINFHLVKQETLEVRDAHKQEM